jgi:arylsulfatase A-like enzyme
MLDHQYSIYEPLLRVPLVIHDPTRFEPGREPRGVMSFDLFPTLLELAGVDLPGPTHAVSLLSPQTARPRFAEEPAVPSIGVRVIKERHADWDSTPWERSLSGIVVGPDKLIRGSDGRLELFDLAVDPLETHNLAGEHADAAATLSGQLDRFEAGLDRCEYTPQSGELSPEQIELLKGLGYAN